MTADCLRCYYCRRCCSVRATIRVTKGLPACGEQDHFLRVGSDRGTESDSRWLFRERAVAGFLCGWSQCSKVLGARFTSVAEAAIAAAAAAAATAAAALATAIESVPAPPRTPAPSVTGSRQATPTRRRPPPPIPIDHPDHPPRQTAMEITDTC